MRPRRYNKWQTYTKNKNEDQAMYRTTRDEYATVNFCKRISTVKNTAVSF